MWTVQVRASLPIADQLTGSDRSNRRFHSGLPWQPSSVLLPQALVRWRVTRYQTVRLMAAGESAVRQRVHATVRLLAAVGATRLPSKRVVCRDGRVAIGSQALRERRARLPDVDHLAVQLPQVEAGLAWERRHYQTGERTAAGQMPVSADRWVSRREVEPAMGHRTGGLESLRQSVQSRWRLLGWVHALDYLGVRLAVSERHRRVGNSDGGSRISLQPSQKWGGPGSTTSPALRKTPTRAPQLSMRGGRACVTSSAAPFAQSPEEQPRDRGRHGYRLRVEVRGPRHLLAAPSDRPAECTLQPGALIPGPAQGRVDFPHTGPSRRPAQR